jgi:hypothetical protein
MHSGKNSIGKPLKATLIAAFLVGGCILGRLVPEYVPTPAQSKKATMKSAMSSPPATSHRLDRSGVNGITDTASRTAKWFTSFSSASVLAGAAVGGSIAAALLGMMLNMGGLQVSSSVDPMQIAPIRITTRTIQKEHSKGLSVVDLRESARAMLRSGHVLQRDRLFEDTATWVQDISSTASGNLGNLVGAAALTGAVHHGTRGKSKTDSKAEAAEAMTTNKATRPNEATRPNAAKPPELFAVPCHGVLGKATGRGKDLEASLPDVVHPPGVMHDPTVVHDPEAVQVPDFVMAPEVFHDQGRGKDLEASVPDVVHPSGVMHDPTVVHDPEAVQVPDCVMATEVFHDHDESHDAAEEKTQGAANKQATILYGSNPANGTSVPVPRSHPLPPRFVSHLQRLGISVDSEGIFQCIRTEAGTQTPRTHALGMRDSIRADTSGAFAQWYCKAACVSSTGE